jgi:hypothetical protein
MHPEPIDKREPFGYTVFCEDIRHEVDGRTSHIGIFPGDIGVPAFPVLFPRIATSLYYREPTELPPVPIELKVIYEPDDGPSFDVAGVELTLEGPGPSKPDTWRLSIVQVVMSPLILQGPGTLKVRAYPVGREGVRMGAVRIALSETIPHYKPPANPYAQPAELADAPPNP